MKLLKKFIDLCDKSTAPMLVLFGVLFIVVLSWVTASNIVTKANSEQILLFKDADSVIVKSLDTTIYKIEELNMAYIITYNKGGIVRQIDK